MSRKPFLIFPRQQPFLPALKSLAARLTENRPGRALLVVPNNRPKRYLRHLYDLEKAASFPEVITIAEATEIWSAAGEKERPRVAGPLDQISLLHECLKSLGRDDKSIAARLADMDMALFLPWGMRLAGLLEELLRQDVAARDIMHAEVEANPTAAALLGALGRIAEAWLAGLSERGWTTPGLICASAALAARSGAPVPRRLAPAPDRPVLAAGFYMLTGTEDALLRRLWREGAYICLHSDAGLVDGAEIHWSSAAHREWLVRWKAGAQAGMPVAPQEAQNPRFSFFAGYDCHSQLAALREKLRDPRYATSTAVVLPDNALLMPALHHLPVKDVNVSMGYPLRRSSLCRLVENLFQLRARSDGGRCYWRDMRQILRHPCLNMLSLQNESGERVFLREGLRRMESLILEGDRFVDVAALLEQCRASLSAPVYRLLGETVDALLRPLENAETTAHIAAWLRGLCGLLLRRGGDMWRRFPLEAEALYRLATSVAPQLDDTHLRTAAFQQAALRNIALHILHAERVPFEAEPIAGLQILGMLETRLLHFDHVFILDATEDKLPGHPAPDPLLPDSLRAVLGLPDARERGRAVAHTLYRLCAGAKEVHFYWQEGTGGSELFDGKKCRSRFVEQLLWEEEQRRGSLIPAGEPPLQTAAAALPGLDMPRREPKKLPLVPHLAEALEAFLRAPLSATRLDAYLQCPLRFAWEHLYRLKPQKSPNEGDDPPAVGDCLHRALRALYLPRLDKPLRREDISLEEAVACFHAAAKEMELERRLPADSWLLLEAAVPFRLGQYLRNQPEMTRVVALEKKLDVLLTLNGREYRFTGVIDRLDRRNEADGRNRPLWVLDYKTGNPKPQDGSLWTDSVFFDRASALCEGKTTGLDSGGDPDALMDEMRSRLPSLQLPCYLTMLKAAGLAAGGACIVPLGRDGREEPLFDGLNDAELAAAPGRCRLTLTLALTHLTRATVFAARPDRHCSWCPYAGLCAS
ncbi:MAG: PD-(D/E)XK nuclease family protein [Desulfovibrio sp.]|jgi:RecB family exonuclease|nr:PD-(D/E)XK nuclease family protein [Desulfovibrio sp.]